MSADDQSLWQKLRSYESPVEMLRSNEQVPLNLPVFPDVYTNVFEEQRSWRETCSLYDQSHHMADLIVSGPDAIDAFSDVAVNSFEDFEVGKAKQLLVCNPKGYYIGDGILSHYEEGEYRLVAPSHGPTWIKYNIERGDYDVNVEFDPNTPARDGPPKSFRYEIMGPNTTDLLGDLTDDPLESIPFFNIREISLLGHDVYALQHTMGGKGGLELWGPWEHAEEIKDAILETGEDYGLRQLGTLTYRSTACFSGWVHFPLPALYDESMRDYQEWLDAQGFAANVSLSGSFYSDELEDYYVTPADVGLERLVSFDHEFIGREALEEHMEDPPRRLVMLKWEGADVVDVYASLFDQGGGDPYKFIELLDPSWGGSHYDEVRRGGEFAGVSKWPVYNTNERAILSLAAIQHEHAEPGNVVTLKWGIPEGEERPPNVERHVPTDIDATVYEVEAFRDQHR